MDELLALMEESIPEEALDTSSVRNPKRNESEVTKRSVSLNRSTSSDSKTHPDLDRIRSIAPQGLAEASIDDKLGIRMIKRRISSIELTDLVASHPYHSTATISAMSREALNRLLAEPAAVISEAEVRGRTIIMTIGIVFTNSGTRISSNGRAFSVLSIGNLNTGPVVSVFLFGEAYSQHCAKCPPGTVVALVTPNLLPPKEVSRDCAVAFSVVDHRQLILVAHARDYGVCKGTVATKRADGQWIPNSGQCKNHVDVRVSPYCLKHRKQENVKNGPMNKAKGLSFMQQQRMEHNSSTLWKAPMANGVMTMQTPAGRVVTHNPTGATLQSQLMGCANDSVPLKAPLHMTKQQFHAAQPLDSRLMRFRSGNSGLLLEQALPADPLWQLPASGRARSKSAGSTKPMRVSDTRVGNQPLHDDWLDRKRNSTSGTLNASSKKRTINTDSGGFDGSVAIPKPSKLFCTKTPSLGHYMRYAVAEQQAPDKARTDSILQNQRVAAQLQKENVQAAQGPTRLSKSNTVWVREMKDSSDDTLKESLFGKVASVDLERVLTAKSLFANEADAEAYAKSRCIVTDLERREEHKKLIETNKKKASGASLKESAIQKEWVCATCRRTTKTRPVICIRTKHNVSLKRDVKTSASVTEKRLELDERSVEDGGLKLGAGLEWDRCGPRF